MDLFNFLAYKKLYTATIQMQALNKSCTYILIYVLIYVLKSTNNFFPRGT